MRRSGALRLPAALVLLLCISSAGLSAAAQKKAKQTTKGSRWRQPPAPELPRGSHMFKRKHDGQDPLVWEDDELTRIRDLHARSFTDKGEYLAASSLADYLGLGAIDQLHVPLPLHIVFIGFQGDGNARVRLDEALLTEWFAHIDHLLPHTRVSLADLTCVDDGHCAGQVEGSMAPSPLAAHVRLNFSCNVVAVQRAEVLETYERAVTAFSRPVDPDFESGTQQVDMLKMEPFIDSFVEGLGLDRGYTMIVVNPKWSSNLQSYGFRQGFSIDEMTLLQDQVPEMRQLSLSHWEGEPAPPRGHAMGRNTGGYYLTGWSHRTQKFSVSQLQAESAAWVRTAQTYLAAEEDHRRKLLKAIGPRTKGSISVARAVGMLRDRHSSETAQLLGAMIMMPPEHFHNPKWRASHPLEDCLTPAWVGHGRWLLLDLTAQKTDWGPAMGGEGVVVSNTVPDVTSIFAEVNEAREVAREDKAGEDDREQELRDELSSKVGSKLAAVAEMHEKERTAAAEQRKREAAHLQGVVHGAKPGEEPEIDGEDEDERRQEAMLHAELDMYEEFALQYCHNRRNPPVACVEAREQATEIRHELQQMASQSPMQVRSFRDHHWDIFGLADDEDTPQEVADANSRAREHFLAQLSDILSHGLRHVIAPPSATWHHNGYLHDSASPYAHKVHFTVYTIQDNSRKLGDWRARGVSFDIEQYKAQVLRLALQHQSFTFTTHELNLLDDPALAAAFSVSLRTAFANVPNAVTVPKDAEVLYIDSSELAAHLRRRFEHTPRRVASPDIHAALEVPVFVFNLDRDIPILVDEHYNARALEDMIIIAENAANQDEHPTGFMCDGALLSRPLSPMRHALAATLLHLGGVLPPHIGYHPGRNLVTHDWLWSVGAHPLSWTSSGTVFSQLHIDALHRSYILDSLDRTVETINAGIELLADEKPDEASYKRVLSAAPSLRSALQLYAQVVNMWRTSVAHSSALEYGSAAELIVGTERLADAFYRACEEVEHQLHPKRCADKAPIAPEVLRWMVGGSAAAVALAALLTCGTARKKAKAG
ncbi:MAG: hypothetical protein J3K34DRAFT_431559 [Monoraphidium minutum]|nr:MAG: hypothetical protein J3K34DRAFT_431559 [Monoraphidium minutum]